MDVAAKIDELELAVARLHNTLTVADEYIRHSGDHIKQDVAATLRATAHLVPPDQ